MQPQDVKGMTRMKKRRTIVTMACFLTSTILFLSACGDKTSVVSETSNNPEHNEIATDNPDDVIEAPVSISVLNDKEAAIVFYADYFDINAEDLTDLAVSFGIYEAGIHTFDTNQFQCDIWKQEGDFTSLVPEGIATYSIESNLVRLNVNMSAVDGFAFSDVKGDTTVYYSCGQGGPYLNYSWDLVTNLSNSNKPITAQAPDNTTTNNSTSEIAESTNDSSNILYLENAYSDGVNTIIFHGSNPAQPTSMTINGNVIVFDSVEVAQNDSEYIQLGLNWTFDGNTNFGDMYYSAADKHIVLKGFAIANEYVPVNVTENTATGPAFLGVKYHNDGSTWGASEFVLSSPDDKGMPTKIVISNSGKTVYGEDLDGTFTIKITDYFEADHTLIGNFVGGSHMGIKGEFVSDNGDRLMIQID